MQRRVAVILANISAHPRLLDEQPDEPEEGALGGQCRTVLPRWLGKGTCRRRDEQVASGGVLHAGISLREC